MADLRVPESMRSGLKLIADLSSEAVDDLRLVLEKNPEVLFSREATIRHAEKLRKLSLADAEALMESVVPLVYFKGAQGKSTQQILTDVSASLQQEKPFTPEQLTRFEKNLSRILDVSGLVLAAKAIAVASDCPRLFSEARILSDLRPVFSEDVTAAPLGAVVTHNLRISYNEEGNEKEFFVYLDSKDLKSLQEQIGRALQKDSTLRRFLENSKLKIYETSI